MAKCHQILIMFLQTFNVISLQYINAYRRSLPTRTMSISWRTSCWPRSRLAAFDSTPWRGIATQTWKWKYMDVNPFKHMHVTEYRTAENYFTRCIWTLSINIFIINDKGWKYVTKTYVVSLYAGITCSCSCIIFRCT